MKRVMKRTISVKWFLLVTAIMMFAAASVFVCNQFASGQQVKTLLEKINTVNTNMMVMNDKDALDNALAVQTALRNVADSIAPAVVNISSRKTLKMQDRYYGLNDDFFRHFFGDQFRMPEQREHTQTMLGSGFIISEDGYVLTNAHVVADAEEIDIQLANSYQLYRAEMVGMDEGYDLALLKITPEQNQVLPTVPLGDSDEVEVGDFAVAVGNPFGLSGTFTFGVVSATLRSDISAGMPAAGKPNQPAPTRMYIQTDTPINQGNSGGPLVNIFGQVVGMNTAILSSSGGSIGIGFALPVNTIKEKLPQLIDGTVQPEDSGFIGLSISPLSPDQSRHLGVSQGALVVDVVPDGPADQAGIKPGDVIVKVDDTFIRSSSDLVWSISHKDIGVDVQVLLVRNGEEVHLPVQVGSKQEIMEITGAEGNESPEALPGTIQGWMGMNFTENTQGEVVITEVIDGSPAYRAGLRQGDILISIQPKNEDSYMIQGLGDIQALVKNQNESESYMIRYKRIMRDGTQMYNFAVVEKEQE